MVSNSLSIFISHFFKDLVDYKHQYYMPAEKEGYSGVAVLSKIKPINVTLGFKDSEAKEHDEEGRLITAEFEKFFLVTTYVPNAGRGLVTLPKRMRWDPLLRNLIGKLDKDKPVILCGDLNVAHKEIDLKNPKTNKKTAGFTEEERKGARFYIQHIFTIFSQIFFFSGFDDLLAEGFVDTFRHFYPEETGKYTFWTYMTTLSPPRGSWKRFATTKFVIKFSDQTIAPALCSVPSKKEACFSEIRNHSYTQ